MNKNMPTIFLVLAIVLVLSAGIYAVTKVMGGKKEDSAFESGAEEGEEPPVSGREDPNDYFTAEELQRNTLDSKGIQPEYEPVLANSPEGRKIIEEIVKDIQTGNGKGLLDIRGTEQIGRELISIPSFSKEANAAIRKMFSYMPPVIRNGKQISVDPDNYYTWPLYGKYEANGIALRKDLEDFLAIPIDKLHLAPGRMENAGWLSSIGLNLMMLTNVNRLPTVKTIRGNWATGGDREGLINYKRVNGFTSTKEMYLAKLVNGRSPYKAYGTRKLAQAILDEMNRFDTVCYRYAKERAIGNGQVIEQALASTDSTTPSSTKGGAVSGKTGAKAQ